MQTRLTFMKQNILVTEVYDFSSMLNLDCANLEFLPGLDMYAYTFNEKNMNVHERC